MNRLRASKIIFGMVWGIVIWMAAAVPTAQAISIDEEEKLSRKFLRMVFKHYDIVDDPVISPYVSGIGRKIMRGLPTQPFKYHFYVVDRDELNAFASPAGHIFIFSGLLQIMESEAELAGILAHEIAHVASRHLSEKLKRAEKINIGTLAGIVAGALLGAGGAGTAAQAVATGTVAAAQSVMLAYSRDDERQADQAGLDYLEKVGYNPRGLALVLKKMRDRQWIGSDQIPTYLKTHPALEDRMAYVDARLAQENQPPLATDSETFQMVQTRLKALFGDKDAARKRFQQILADRPQDPLAQYGMGLVMDRLGDREQAITWLKQALARRAFDTTLLTDLGRIYFLTGRYAEALRTLTATVDGGPFNSDGYFYLGRTQLALGNMRQAVESLEELLRRRPRHQEVLYFLGQSHGKLAQLDQAHYYLGRYYAQKMQTKNALFHLERALAENSDPDRETEIKRLLKKLRKERQVEGGIRGAG